MTHPFDSIPELAGVATYRDAARVGYSVADNVGRLLHFHWTERMLMRVLVARIPSMPIWEVKCAFALHQWQAAQRIDALRARISEMRSPAPNLDEAPEDVQLHSAFTTIERTGDPKALVELLYKEVIPALRDGYRAHLQQTNPLVDHPTCRILRLGLVEIDDAIRWGEAAISALERTSPSAESRDAVLSEAKEPMAENNRMLPLRDERFHGQYNFEFPPHVVYNMPQVPADERNLALLCKRALEMDVPEMMASFMTERADQPWEFYRDYSRQLWDEARHAMMGTVALEARGIDWKREIPLNISFALRLNLHATPLERQTMLYAIEQSLMPGETGKRSEYETAVEAGDTLSAHFHDYDWADEVLHAQIGRRMLKRDGITSQQAAERAHGVHEKTWAALDRYRHLDAQENWWPAFVRKALGKNSALETVEPPARINVFNE